jgi:hypothetical protein
MVPVQARAVPKLTHALSATAVTATLLLTGCGPDATPTSSTTSSTTSSETPSRQASADTTAPAGSDQMDAIQSCLKDAGLEDKLPQRPPQTRSTDQPPPAPQAGQPNVERRAEGPFADKEVQNALKACGIEVPEPPAGGPPN